VTDARYTYTAGMPAGRVGWLVARARSIAGIGERDLASSVGVPVRTVRRWERGDLVPSDDEVEAIASACGARLTELLPRRNVVAYDPSTGIMQMADQAVAIPITTLDNDTVLAAFVALVRRVRGLRLDQDVKVRQEDLDTLGEVLDVDDEELEERLMRIIGMSRSQAAAVRAQLLRKRLAVPMVGMLASLSLLGVNRLFTTGSEQVKAIDGKVETVFLTPTTTTTVASSSDGAAAAPAVTAAAGAQASSAAASVTQAAPADSPVQQVTSTTQPFIGPKFPVTVRTGPPATTPGRRPATGDNGGTSPTEPSGGALPVTEPPSGGDGGGGSSTTTPVIQPPTSPPTTGLPAVPIPPPPPAVTPIAPTDGSMGTTEPTTTTTTPSTDPSPTTTTTTPPTTALPSPVTTIDDGHTTETTPRPPPSSPTTIGGIGTTGGSDPGSS
jgi:transcriptional regulator with XRE-family HTH domain